MSVTSLHRLERSFFLLHLAVTLALGHLVLPQFERLGGSPPLPPTYAPVLVAAVRAFYFPLVSWAASSHVIGLSRPNFWLALCNSAVVSVILFGPVSLLMWRKTTVA